MVLLDGIKGVIGGQIHGHVQAARLTHTYSRCIHEIMYDRGRHNTGLQISEAGGDIWLHPEEG